MSVQAQHLQAGDIVGSGEIVRHVSAGTRTPKGKVDIQLSSRFTQWGKYTEINIERPEKPMLAIETREDGIS